MAEFLIAGHGVRHWGMDRGQAGDVRGPRPRRAQGGVGQGFGYGMHMAVDSFKITEHPRESFLASESLLSQVVYLTFTWETRIKKTSFVT